MVEYLAACIIAQLEGLMYHQTIYWKYMHVQQFNTDGVIISIIKKKRLFLSNISHEADFRLHTK
jgi:uncharacterized membrane protein YobD (UPF0266 family)